ncbi:MAG: FG-GAP repeat domain-containing protein, partial [Chitinophagales bacterium]
MKTIRVAGALLGITVLIAGLFWGNAPVRAAGPVEFDVSNCEVGGNSFNVISADFNGDNELDLAGTLPDDSKAFVVLGNGNGTFQAAATYAVGTAPQGITTGDFNGDSKLDLAVANSGSNNVSVLLGNGDGTFSAAPETPAVGTTPRDITSVRFNSDNNVDLAVVNAASDNVSILLGDGDGTFQTAYTLGTGNGPWGITAADFNGDSKPELAICNRASDNVSILKYSPGGVPVVNPLPSPGVGDSPQGIITGDFNNDNKLDLAVANNASDNVSVLIG